MLLGVALIRLVYSYLHSCMVRYGFPDSAAPLMSVRLPPLFD